MDKPITIKPGSITKNRIPFTLGELTKGKYFVAIYDAAEHQVHWELLSADKKTEPIDISDAMAARPPGTYELRVYTDGEFLQSTGRPAPGAAPSTLRFRFISGEAAPPVIPVTPTVVRLAPTAAEPTPDRVLNSLVLAATSARMFPAYKAFVDRTVCARGNVFAPDAYDVLVAQTRLFLARSNGVLVDQQELLSSYLSADGLLPYVETVVSRYPDALSGDPCSDIDPNVLGAVPTIGAEPVIDGDIAFAADVETAQPFPVELIWSYWQEEGGLVQTLNHILARFQNRRVAHGPDPLARFDLSPLRPLRHLLWAWAEAEISRLTVRRRAAEYEYEYGLSLIGRAVPDARRFTERRTRFLEAFHTLLHEAHVFFALDDDTTVHADAFPVLNALRDTHLVLAEGSHNQFGDLPTDARVQMLIMQWLLAQPEMRDFLGGRPMVPYEEPWMDRVDSMKSISGWTTTSVTHFHELAVRGEQLLLTIRWGNWNGAAVTADSAMNWARAWRNTIQRYVHAYRAATGVDLVTQIDARMPADLLLRRVSQENVRSRRG